LGLEGANGDARRARQGLETTQRDPGGGPHIGR
jgi:hypothetical protein